jgi:hypothetical protein
MTNIMGFLDLNHTKNTLNADALENAMIYISQTKS